MNHINPMDTARILKTADSVIIWNINPILDAPNLPDTDRLSLIVSHRCSKIDIIYPGNEHYNSCQDYQRKDQHSTTVDFKFLGR